MINFLKYTKLYFILSGIILAVGIASITLNGFVYSIDFKGGSNVEYSFESVPSKDKVRDTFEKKGSKVFTIASIGDQTYSIKTSPLSETTEEDVRVQLEKMTKGSIDRLRFETVGPTLGKETVNKTFIAALAAVVGILLYMTFAFKRITYGIAAITAMAHDFLILAGMYSLMTVFAGAEVDTLFVTAALTTMSFSVHDTIVVFDKIREHESSSGLSISTIANKALTETMVRSINNSVTIILMLVPLVLLGGTTIRFFASALLIGTIAGTYSSPFIATPILVFLEKRKT